MNYQLWQLRPGDSFMFLGFKYTVCQQSGPMTEVFGKERFWAWPCLIKLSPQYEKLDLLHCPTLANNN